jgi:hypothetical protein
MGKRSWEYINQKLLWIDWFYDPSFYSFNLEISMLESSLLSCFRNFMTNSGLLFISELQTAVNTDCRWRMWCNRELCYFSKTDASELKEHWFGQQLLKTMNTASKEVVCFKIIMQHTLFMPLHLQFPAYVPWTPFWNTVLALNIFLQ